MSYSIWAGAKHHWPEWLQLANTHYQNHQFDSAYTYYFRTGHFQETPDSIKAQCFKKLGIILYQQEEYRKSIENFKQASKFFNTINDLENEHKCWSNLANVYVKLGKYDLAEKLYEKRLQKALENKDQTAQYSTHINFGYLYNHAEQYNRAANHLVQAQKLAASLKDNFKMQVALHNLTTMYLNQEVPDSALFYLRISSSSSNNLILKEAALWNLKELHFQLGNIDSAYFYKSQYHVVADSLKNKEIALTIARLETELQQEKDRVRFATFLNWAIALTATLIIALVLWYIDKQNANKRLKEYRRLTNMFIQQLKVFENEKTEVGSKLHSSVMPTLVAIRGFLKVGNTEKAEKYLEEVGEEIFNMQDNQFYNRRFDHSDWLVYTPTNAKHHSKWIEIKLDHKPTIYTHEFQIATLSILEQLLQDGQQKLEVYPDEYGVEVNYTTPIKFSENTKALLSFFDCTVQNLRIHIPLLENRI